MKKYLIKFMPFWGSEVIGIISKLCLTYTTVIMGLLLGIIGVVYGSSVLIKVLLNITLISNPSKTSLIFILIFHGLFYILYGIVNIYHYIYASKGFNLRSHKYIKKSYIMFRISWFMYEYRRYGLSLITLISAAILISILGIPLRKAEKSFKDNSV